jgi:hypothetical protein
MVIEEEEDNGEIQVKVCRDTVIVDKEDRCLIYSMRTMVVNIGLDCIPETW